MALAEKTVDPGNALLESRRLSILDMLCLNHSTVGCGPHTLPGTTPSVGLSRFAKYRCPCGRSNIHGGCSPSHELQTVNMCPWPGNTVGSILYYTILPRGPHKSA